MLDKAYGSVDIVAITPSGRQISLLKLRGPRPQWFRRYWLQEAIELSGGSAIEARFTPLGDYSDEMQTSVRQIPAANRGRLRAAVEKERTFATLFFEKSTGLLARTIRFGPSPIGFGRPTALESAR